MKRLALVTIGSAALLMTAGFIAGGAPAWGKKPAAGTDDATGGDPNAPLVKPYGGKVWVQREAFPATEGTALAAYLGANPAVNEIVRKDKESPWLIQYLAVFKKPSVKGSLTVEFAEKGSLREIVDQYSPDSAASGLVYQATYEVSEDHGFNKGHSYTIHVGQILNGKFVAYAGGEFSLK